MDNTIDSLKNELKKAQLELDQIKQDTIIQIAKEQASAKVAMARATATAYAEGMKEALKKLEQHIQKQHDVLAAAVVTAEESAKKITKAAMAKEAAAAAKRTATAEKAAAAKKTAADKKAATSEKNAAKKAGPISKNTAATTSKKADTAQIEQPDIPATAGSLHEKRLGILEREFNPPKSVHGNPVETTPQDYSDNPDNNNSDWS